MTTIDEEPEDEFVPTLVLVGAALGGAVLVAAGLVYRLRDWLWLRG